MASTVFKEVGYSVGGLVEQIKIGSIGLPDIQRPFVWGNTKVRDLFDSMYRGYPIGYLLFWENGVLQDNRSIGTHTKQLPPSLVIVDGQQRLTSIYAVFTGSEIVRSDFSLNTIQIAFNPLTETFEVPSAATKSDRAFIPDISVLLSGSESSFAVYGRYLDSLRSVREVSQTEIARIESAIERLQALATFPLTALQLAADISEEDVAEVFVRVNSTGKPLSQADFILTLMSVFWDSGRAELEAFSREAKTPSVTDGSPHNPYIEPSPDQLLRVTVAVAFRRARLRSVYAILRGKEVDSVEFAQGSREERFSRLEDAQTRVLDLENWHGFLSCLHAAGFRSSRMINSANALLMSYALYLVGRTEIHVDERDLRPAISRWFFMASLTGRYSGATETAMESDLSLMRGVEASTEFLEKLNRECAIALTADFWEVTLPNDLAASAARSPSISAFEAALVLLDAPALFSESRVEEWLDPRVTPAGPVDREHLFPRAHLKTRGITGTRDVNQIANYAYLERRASRSVLSQSPTTYLPIMTEGISQSKLARMSELHALPAGWEEMKYHEFLERRRELIAQIVRKGYDRLACDVAEDRFAESLGDVSALVSRGEGEAVEFKSTLRVNLHTGKRDAQIEHAVVKTIAGFLNTHGGTLIVGVADDGTPVGVDGDGFANEDKMSQSFGNLISHRLPAKVWAHIHANFEDFESVPSSDRAVRTSSRPRVRFRWPLLHQDCHVDRRTQCE